MDRLVQSLGVDGLLKLQLSRMPRDLNEQVQLFRSRPLDDAGPFTLVAADALATRVREQGRVVNSDGDRKVSILSRPVSQP